MLAQTVTTPDTTTWIYIAVAVIVVLGLVAVFARRQRSNNLRRRFGPEYDRTVASMGSPERAETELARREQRVRSFDIRQLTPGARDRYAEAWRRVQADFVDNPPGAVRDADSLVSDVMRDRGYPIDDMGHRTNDLSVEHAGVVNNYRMAAEIAQLSSRGKASTEDLRQAMVYYRSLFTELLGTDPVKSESVEAGIVQPRSPSTRQGVRS
jgi:hypothetical protein